MKKQWCIATFYSHIESYKSSYYYHTEWKEKSFNHTWQLGLKDQCVTNMFFCGQIWIGIYSISLKLAEYEYEYILTTKVCQI